MRIALLILAVALVGARCDQPPPIPDNRISLHLPHPNGGAFARFGPLSRCTGILDAYVIPAPGAVVEYVEDELGVQHAAFDLPPDYPAEITRYDRNPAGGTYDFDRVTWRARIQAFDADGDPATFDCLPEILPLVLPRFTMGEGEQPPPYEDHFWHPARWYGIAVGVGPGQPYTAGRPETWGPTWTAYWYDDVPHAFPDPCPAPILPGWCALDDTLLGMLERHRLNAGETRVYPPAWQPERSCDGVDEALEACDGDPWCEYVVSEPCVEVIR